MKTQLLALSFLASFNGVCQERDCFKNLDSLVGLVKTSYQDPNLDNPKTTQLQANQMVAASAAYSDSVLNVVYQELQEILECLNNSWTDEYLKTMKEETTRAQRAWIITRDADALFYHTSAYGGSIAPMWYSNELRQSTDQRTKQLLEMIKHLKWRQSIG